AFRIYFHGMIESLEVSDAARGIARELLKLTPGSWPAIAPLRLLTAGLLPETMREQYGLGWGPKRDVSLRALQSMSRAIVPRLPGRIRQPPWFLMPSRP
ncbi:MAG TPA: oxygenase MpaB family protein, partial [Dehalococcoidia bacterium]|nr:oxygenase MpaB family protein [Dehalococcoidia bacterium]